MARKPETKSEAKPPLVHSEPIQPMLSTAEAAEYLGIAVP